MLETHYQLREFSIKELEEVLENKALNEGLLVEFHYSVAGREVDYIEKGLTLKQVAYISDTTEETVLKHSQTKLYELCSYNDGVNSEAMLYHPDILKIWRY